MATEIQAVIDQGSEDRLLIVTLKQLPYCPPVLKSMGDIRSVTLGSSPGATESSGGSISRKPAGT